MKEVKQINLKEADELFKHRHCYYVDLNSYNEKQKGYQVSMVFEDVPGHYPTTWFWGPDYTTAEECAKMKNQALGLTEMDVVKIVCSSMRVSKK
jgi:hypothetical protein